jgi:hypothetical protein
MSITYTSGALNVDIQADLSNVSGNDLRPLLTRIPKYKIGVKQIRWNADAGGSVATGELVTAAGNVDTTGTTITPASLAIADSRFRVTFSVETNRLEEAKNAGVGEVANMLALASKASMRQIIRQISANLYTGTGVAASGGMFGLASLHTSNSAGRTTNAYAGITPTGANIRWSNYINTDAAPRALSSALLFKMSEEILGGVTVGVDSNFTAIYTTPALATTYKQLFQLSSDLDAGINGVADLGYSGMSFEGRPIFVDPACPAGTMYFVDESQIGLYDFVEGASAYGEEKPYEAINLKIVEMARTNPDFVQFSVVSKNQLCVARRPAVAILNQLS